MFKPLRTSSISTIIATLAICLVADASCASPAIAASRATCTGTDEKRWSVPVGCAAARVTITHDNAIVDAAPPTKANAKTGVFLALTVVQDAKGHPVVWGKHVGVDPTTASGNKDPVRPPSAPHSEETYFLVWQPAPAAVWKIVARSRNRAESGVTSQGNNEQLGFGNGNINVTNKPAVCTPNHWTQYMSDNGGFVGWGVRDYLYNVAGETTICNPNGQSAFYSIVCSVGGYLGRVDGDHEIEGNQCIHIPYEAAQSADTHYFLNFICFINPTDPLLVWYTKNHSMELPID
jgi:hypothetical protein